LVASGESSGLSLPSLEKNAAAYEIPYFRIETHDDIHTKIQEVVDADGAAFCEVLLPATHVTAPKTSVYKRADGSFSARPMEDLAPFLDREEFRENMLIEMVDE